MDAAFLNFSQTNKGQDSTDGIGTALAICKIKGSGFIHISLVKMPQASRTSFWAHFLGEYSLLNDQKGFRIWRQTTSCIFRFRVTGTKPES